MSEKKVDPNDPAEIADVADLAKPLGDASATLSDPSALETARALALAHQLVSHAEADSTSVETPFQGAMSAPLVLGLPSDIAPGQLAPGEVPSRRNPSDVSSPAPTIFDTNMGATLASPALPDLIGDRYKVLSLVGEGGMGYVYKAQDTQLNEVVALKLLRPDLLDNTEAVDRFKREVKLARRVTHRHVARTYDLGQHGSNYYLTMEYIEGESLADLIEREGALPLPQALAIGASMALGLEAAHQAHVIHRDLKPANVLLSHEGRVLLSDFGIAGVNKHLSDIKVTGSPLGTPAYMSPEQLQGRQDIDHRADLFALGLILYELVSGKRAWLEENPFSLIYTRLSGVEAPDLDTYDATLPKALVSLVKLCMSWEREHRPQHAAAVVGLLDNLRNPSANPGAATLTQEIRALTSHGEAAPRARWAQFLQQGMTTTLSDKRVAVIPFRAAEDDSFLTEGLTEDLSDLLSMLAGVKVRPMRLVRQVASDTLSTEELAAKLEVDVLIEGSLRRQGDKLHIPVRLLSGEDGYQMWARRFQGSTGDLFAISEQVAAAVADALTLKSNADVRLTTTNPEAIELYFRARQEQREHWHGDLAGAVALYNRGLKLVPDDPMMLVGAASTHVRSAFYTANPDAVDVAKARGLAERAVAGSPNRAEPFFAMALVHYYGVVETSSSISALCAALSRSPLYPEALALLGRVLIEVGPLADGIVFSERAISLDPKMLNVRWDLMRAYALAGDWSQSDMLGDLPVEGENALRVRAVTRCRLDLWRGTSRWIDDPAPTTSADSALNHGLVALFHVRKTGELPPRNAMPVLGDFIGDETLSRWRLAFLQGFAEALMYTKSVDACLTLLQRLVERGVIDLMWLQHCPLFSPLREGAPFQALLAQCHERVSAIHAAV